MPFFPGRHIRPRSRRTAAPINEMIDVVRAHDRFKVGPGLGFLATSAGMVLYVLDPKDTRIAKSDGAGIPAISGTTPGKSSVTIHTFDGTSLSPSAPMTVYNISTTAVGANKWLIVQRIGQYWFVIVEAC
jgi:hypothetical protein